MSEQPPAPATKPLDSWTWTPKEIAEFFGLSWDHVRNHPEKYLGAKIGGIWRFNVARILHKGEVVAQRKAAKRRSK